MFSQVLLRLVFSWMLRHTGKRNATLSIKKHTFEYKSKYYQDGLKQGRDEKPHACRIKGCMENGL